MILQHLKIIKSVLIIIHKTKTTWIGGNNENI